MAISFSETDYKNVRALIDISLTADDLSDDQIGLDSFKGEAVEIIEHAVASLSEEQQTEYATQIKRAAIRLTASFLAPKVPILTSEVLEGDKFTFADKNFAKVSADLEKEAFGIVARILKAVSDTPTETSTSFAEGIFTLGGASCK